MTENLTDQQIALRATLEAALRAAAADCTPDCPAECRTHHPSLFAGGMTAGGLAESIDGDIDAIAHVAAIAIQGEITRLRALVAEMTRCRDNALAALYRDDVETDPHMPDLFADGLHGLYDWEDQPEPDSAPQELVDRCVRIVQPAFGKLTQERDSLRAELALARASAPLLIARDDLTELDTILTAERYRLDKGDGTPVPQPRWGANVRVSQAVQAALTGGDPPRPSPDHSAVYMDGDQAVWSEYKTVSESDAVVPLVWAAEKTSSREELADAGTVLRIVGWIK